MSKKTSITALSYINGADVSYGAAMRYFTPGSIGYNSSLGFEYRTIASGLFNGAKTASLITIETIVDPDADAIVPFILFVRNILSVQASTANATSIKMNTYLFGGYTAPYDLQNALYELVPIMILSTVLVVLVLVAMNFGSVFIPIRLAATVFVSLSWTYGLTGINLLRHSHFTHPIDTPSQTTYWYTLSYRSTVSSPCRQSSSINPAQAKMHSRNSPLMHWQIQVASIGSFLSWPSQCWSVWLLIMTSFSWHGWWSSEN